MDIFLAIFSNEDNTPLNKTPIITGIVTIKNICDAILNNDCPSLIPPMSRTLNDIININGTVITHKILFIAVKDIAQDNFTILSHPDNSIVRVAEPKRGNVSDSSEEEITQNTEDSASVKETPES